MKPLNYDKKEEFKQVLDKENKNYNEFLEKSDEYLAEKDLEKLYEINKHLEDQMDSE